MRYVYTSKCKVELAVGLLLQRCNKTGFEIQPCFRTNWLVVITLTEQRRQIADSGIAKLQRINNKRKRIIYIAVLYVSLHRPSPLHNV